MYQLFNILEILSIDYMYHRGTKYIDSIVATENIMNFIDSSSTDYRAYIIDINLEDYFNKEFCR